MVSSRCGMFFAPSLFHLPQLLFSDHTEIDTELRAVAEEMEVVAGRIEKSIAANAITALD